MDDLIDFTNNHDNNSVNILLVEDDEKDLIIACKNIKRIAPNANIVPVKSLRSAYMALRSHDFDLVLLDLNLSDTFGPNTVRELRQFDRNTPVIVITGMLTPITIDQVLKLGANDVLSKSQFGAEDFQHIFTQNLTRH